MEKYMDVFIMASLVIVIALAVYAFEVFSF